MLRSMVLLQVLVPLKPFKDTLPPSQEMLCRKWGQPILVEFGLLSMLIQQGRLEGFGGRFSAVLGTDGGCFRMKRRMNGSSAIAALVRRRVKEIHHPFWDENTPNPHLSRGLILKRPSPAFRGRGQISSWASVFAPFVMLGWQC